MRAPIRSVSAPKRGACGTWPFVWAVGCRWGPGRGWGSTGRLCFVSRPCSLPAPIRNWVCIGGARCSSGCLWRKDRALRRHRTMNRNVSHTPEKDRVQNNQDCLCFCDRSQWPKPIHQIKSSLSQWLMDQFIVLVDDKKASSNERRRYGWVISTHLWTLDVTTYACHKVW